MVSELLCKTKVNNFESWILKANDLSNVVTLYTDASLFPYSIFCDTNLSTSVSWIIANENKTNFNFLVPDNRHLISNDTKVLTLINVKQKDQKFYACGYINEAKSFKILSAYFLFVRSMFYI